MRIAHVIDSLEVGGAESVVAALCRSHLASGHHLEVHCLMAGGRFATELTQEGVEVFVHGSATKPGSAFGLFTSFRKSRPEVVHCHNKTATVRAAVAARLAGVNALVSTRHGMVPLPFRMRKELKFWITAACCCDRVVAVCDEAHRNMTAGARPVAYKLATIRNGAYPSRKGSGLPVVGNGFTLVSVGRLVAVKSFDTLLRAVAIARRDVPDLTLWIVGAGNERSALERLADELGVAPLVRFCGEQRDVGRWLSAADVFVLPSTSEGLPISLLEAMAAGLPAIVTDVGALPELVALSGAGTIVPPRRADCLARAIVEFAGRRLELARLGRKAFDCYEAHFTPDRMAGEYLALYRACLSRGFANRT
jgi:glycosyltransferase involved in cell wall biosynthesis